MDQTLSSQVTRSQSRQTVTDIIVVTAMVLVAIAISVGVSLHFGLPASRAGVAGVLIFALLVGAHFLLVPRATTAKEITELEDEELWNALKEQRLNAPDAKRMAMATRTEVADPTPKVDQGEPATSAPHPVAGGAAAVGVTTDGTANKVPTETPAVAHVPRRKPRIVTKAKGQAHEALGTAQLGGSGPSEISDPESYWSYRPSSDGLAGDEAVDSAPAPHAAIAHGHPDTPGSESALDGSRMPEDGAGNDAQSQPIRESDVELVQSMIKKLAHEVNAAEVLEKTASHGEMSAGDDAVIEDPQSVAPSAPVLEDRVPDAQVLQTEAAPAPAAVQPPQLPPRLPSESPTQVTPDGFEHVPPTTAEPSPQIIAQSAPPAKPQAHVPPSSPAAVDLVTQSVDALRSTAEVMRDADEAAPDDAPQVDQPLRPAMQPEASQVAAAISAALEGGQIGVLLEPIVTLTDMRPDHYEVRLQVTAPHSGDLDGDGVERDLQASGVLAEVDRERFIKTLSVGELLHERGKAGSLLTRIYRESLLNRDFCFAVATSGVANEALARHMVLTLTQAAVRALSASEWQTLSEFHELGYRFAVSHVHDLDMDFAQLTAAGFSFVKLNADMFLGNGLSGDGDITPKELTRYLLQSGLTPIIDGLADSARAGEALAMGAGLGQGPFTGGPRLMKAEAVASDHHAVA